MIAESLIKHFHSYIPLRQAERQAVIERVEEITIKRRQFLLFHSEVCRHYYFVVNGLFKMYAIDPEGMEHNIQFAAEGDWITDNASFHSEQPSPLSIKAIEPSRVLQIGRSDLVYLFHHYPKFDRIFRVIIENKYQDLQSRLLQTISVTAGQRYENFLVKYPQVANRLPNTDIASYLGITPEFLSKIRRRRVGK